MKKLYRSAQVKIEVLSGRENLERAGWLAKTLWNNALWQLFGYNRQLRRIRGDSWEQFKRNSPHMIGGGKYPGFVGLQNELRSDLEAQSLSDMCFSYTIKELDEAIRSWMSSLKLNPKARSPRYAREPRGLTFMVDFKGKRNAKPIGDWMFRLTVLGGHIPDRHAIIKIYLRDGVKMNQIRTIRYHADGTGIITYQIEPQPEPGHRRAGVDLGIINLAALAFDDGESILYSGKGLLSEMRLNDMRASKCKPSNWIKGQKVPRSTHAEEYGRKSGRVRRLAVHNVTTHIIQACVAKGVNTLVIGDLKGIRDGKNMGKAGNQKFHTWAFGEMRRQLEYKAAEYRIKVIPVNEAYTSQTCHLCGRINKGNRKHRGLYHCDTCGAVMNADVNGAFNILNKVSPAPAYAGVGVGGDFPTPPSTGAGQGTGEERRRQIDPTYVAKFDLRDYAIVQSRCTRERGDNNDRSAIVLVESGLIPR